MKAMTHPRKLSAAVCLAAALATTSALAEEELIEKVVVRNRLYTVSGKNEIGLNVGFSLLARLTDHINFNLHYARNLSDTFGFEVRGGYAYSRHTGLANQIADEFQRLRRPRVTDLKDLWELNGNAMVGVRWAPVYGKINLMSELPVHFQAYLWAGAGAGQFKRESIVVCNQRSGSECVAYYQQNNIGPLASGAVGLRFFAAQKHSLKVEVRDYSYIDSFLEDVDPTAALNSATPEGGGHPSRNAGITNLVQVDLGYSYTF